MYRRILRSGLIMLILLIMITLVMNQQKFPWWTFVVPVVILGVVVGLVKWKVPAFAIGFITGFIIWGGGNAYFDMVFDTGTLNRIGLLMSIPKWGILGIAGAIGGLLTGMALFTG